MPGLYDSWNLSNSHSIPQYQGSTIPELTQTANVMEGRYDAGAQQADLLDQALKTSSSASVDAPVLNDLKNQYRQKLQGYAQKGDYENMWRNVALDARDFHDKYSQIQGNAQAISGWSADLDKRVGEGKLSSTVADARKKEMQDTYSGLKSDPETGQLTNPFQGKATMPSVDYPTKINKWLENSHAVERGWKVEKDVNGWYQTNGTETKRLPWSMIKPVIDAGMALDPEVKGDMAQEHELAPYYSGLSRKISPEQVKALASSSPQLGDAINQKINQGMDPVSALHDVVGDQHVRSRVNEIYDYAKKGVIDDVKGEYEEKMDAITEDRLKKNQLNQLFSAPFSDVGPGQQVKSVQDFNNILSSAQTDRENAYKTLGAFKNAPDHVEKNGFVYRKEPDGTLTDITADADRLRGDIKSKEDNYQQLQALQKSAADATGYHPDQMSPTQQKNMQKNEDDLYNEYYNDKLREERDKDYRVSSLTPDQATQARQAAHTSALAQRNGTHPAYSDYEQELVKRLQPQGVGNRMLVFKDDDMKKTLGDFATDAISNLGAKSGLVSLQMASGKDMGTNLDANSYDDIKGKVVPLGITNDAKTGETKIVLRALQDIKGKKIAGDNILMSMKDIGGIDDYVKAHVTPQEYSDFKMDQVLKGGLNNVAGQMDMPIADKDGKPAFNVKVLRRNTDKQGAGSFGVRIPTASGYKELPADSYESVIDIINRLQQHAQK